MWDYLRARKDGRPQSGNGRRQSYQYLPMVRMTNTFVLDGPDDPDDIIASTPNGVYVAKLGGGSVNTASGDFVFGMTEAYLIENGEITEPLRDGNLIGNGPKVLQDIDMLANDFAMGSPGTCGKDGQGVPGRRRPADPAGEVADGGRDGMSGFESEIAGGRRSCRRARRARANRSRRSSPVAARPRCGCTRETSSTSCRRRARASASVSSVTGAPDSPTREHSTSRPSPRCSPRRVTTCSSAPSTNGRHWPNPTAWR